MDPINKQLVKEIVELGKPHKIRNSPQYIGIYKREGNLFWAATIQMQPSSSEKEIYAVTVQIKPIEFDEIDAVICHPCEKVKRSNGYFANPGYHLYTINQEPYRYTIQNPSSLSSKELGEVLHQTAQAILTDVLRTVDDFLKTITKDYGNIYSFFIAKREEEPAYAGLCYIHLGDYENALKCFELADEKKQYPHLCIGNHFRHFHQICMDYCKVMILGNVWKAEYVVNGLPNTC